MRQTGLIVALCGGLLALITACSGGGSDQAQITNRVQSFVTHFNEDDAKAILNSDVPTSFRRTCSDQDAANLIKQAQRFGAKLSVRGVNDIQVNGDKATASVSFGTGISLLPDTPPATMPFVKSDGAWRIDTSAAAGTGCNALLTTGLNGLSNLGR